MWLFMLQNSRLIVMSIDIQFAFIVIPTGLQICFAIEALSQTDFTESSLF